jgi:hypothetical protein
LKHLKSIYTFPDKSVQVPEKSGQDVLADFEQQFIPSPQAGADLISVAEQYSKLNFYSAYALPI